MFGAYGVGSGDLTERVEDGGGARHGGDIDILMLMLGKEYGLVILPVHKLDGRHQEIAVGPSAMSKDGGDAHAVVDGMVVVVSERD